MASEENIKERKTNEKEKKTTKKKIIPVVSDSDSSPSPEEPSSPADTAQPLSLSARFRNSQRISQNQKEVESIKGKLKNSSSFCDRQSQDENKQKQSKERQPKPLYSPHMSETSQGPPHGTRVVLGRETSPVPAQQGSRIPGEILQKFSGQSREDLIEMVVRLQGQVEGQGKKTADMEEYIDMLLVKVMDNTPVLLEKNIMSCKPSK